MAMIAMTTSKLDQVTGVPGSAVHGFPPDEKLRHIHPGQYMVKPFCWPRQEAARKICDRRICLARRADARSRSMVRQVKEWMALESHQWCSWRRGRKAPALWCLAAVVHYLATRVGQETEWSEGKVFCGLASRMR